MALTLYTSEVICSSYIYSMLVGVSYSSITEATCINSIYSVGSSFWIIILGIALKYYGRIKIYTSKIGRIFFILGQGLKIAFALGFTLIALIIVCKILIAFGGGNMYPIEQMPLMAVSQEKTSALLAVGSVIVDIGKGAGSAIATAMWTSMFLKKLAQHLPSDQLGNLSAIYGSLDMESSYPLGSSAQAAIEQAYLQTQRIIFTSSTALLAVTWASVCSGRTSISER